MAKASRKRKSYSPELRQQIMETAARDGLTALDVKKQFGVTPVTYYSWRKKSGAVARRGRGAAKVSVRGGSDFSSQLRTEVRARIQEMLPGIVKSEVATFMEGLFGANPARRKV